MYLLLLDEPIAERYMLSITIKQEDDAAGQKLVIEVNLTWGTKD